MRSYYAFLVLSLCIVNTASLSGAAQAPRVGLDVSIRRVQRSVEDGRQIDFEEACLNETTFKRIYRIVRNCYKNGGFKRNNTEHMLSWCVCKSAPFEKRIALINTIVEHALLAHPEREERLVITSLGAGFLLLEYLLISELLHEGYSNIYLVGIDHYDQVPTYVKNYIDGEIPVVLRNALHKALAADSEVSVVYNSVPSVEEYIAQGYPRADYFLIIDMNTEVGTIDRGRGRVPQELSRRRYNQISLKLKTHELWDYSVKIGFDISKERLGKAPRPAVALRIREVEWREPVEAILDTVLQTVADQSQILPAIIEGLLALDLPEDMQIRVCSLALNEVAYRHEWLLHEGAQVFILTNGEARNVTDFFGGDEENIVVLRDKIVGGPIQ